MVSQLTEFYSDVWKETDWYHVITDEVTVQNHVVSYILHITGEEACQFRHGYSKLCLTTSPEIEFDQLSNIKLPKFDTDLRSFLERYDHWNGEFGTCLQSAIDEKLGQGKKFNFSRIDFFLYANPGKGGFQVRSVGKIDGKVYTIVSDYDWSEGGPPDHSVQITEN